MTSSKISRAEQARQDGYDAGYQDGREVGLRDGYKDGRELPKLQAPETLRDLANLLDAVRRQMGAKSMLSTVMSADAGVIPVPRYCPAWCDREQHLTFISENDGLDSAEELTMHRRFVDGPIFLPEIRTGVDKRTERAAGGYVEMCAAQRLLPPYADGAGFASQPLLEVTVADDEHSRTSVALTTGEARVLALKLTALCDLVDLEGLR